MSRLVWLLLAVCLVVSISMLAYPTFVIQPFRYQGERELKVALWMVEWRLYFEIAAIVGAIATLLYAWPRALTKSRTAVLVAVVLVCVAAGLTRINIFEKMFHPYTQPAFSAASDSKLDADDKVLAIVVIRQARAYPIRTIAYHHIINDEVGGLPVVATY